MEDAGFVSRRRDSEDNRLVRVYITELGREKKRFIVEQYFKLESVIFSGFEESERSQLRQYLGRALNAMNQLR
jgi:DNA-binding MarR family transcriptional regulator